MLNWFRFEQIKFWEYLKILYDSHKKVFFNNVCCRVTLVLSALKYSLCIKNVLKCNNFLILFKLQKTFSSYILSREEHCAHMLIDIPNNVHTGTIKHHGNILFFHYINWIDVPCRLNYQTHFLGICNQLNFVNKINLYDGLEGIQFEQMQNL